MLILIGSLWFGIILLPALSALYFMLAADLPMNERTFASAHGILILSAAGVALILSGKNGLSDQQQVVFNLILFVAFCSAAYSCWALNVRWLTHFLHVVTLWYILAVSFFEGMLRDSF